MEQVACSEYIESINAWLDGELASNEKRELHRHLRGCTDCQNYLVTMGALKGRMQQSSIGPSLPARLKERIFSLLNDADTTTSLWTQELSRRAVVATSALLITIALTAIAAYAIHNKKATVSLTPFMLQDILHLHNKDFQADKNKDLIPVNRHGNVIVGLSHFPAHLIDGRSAGISVEKAGVCHCFIKPILIYILNNNRTPLVLCQFSPDNFNPDQERSHRLFGSRRQYLAVNTPEASALLWQQDSTWFGLIGPTNSQTLLPYAESITIW